MIMIRFRSKEDHEDLLKKVKKMRKFTEELEECLEDAIEEDNLSYRHDDDDEFEDERRSKVSRYSAYRGGRRM